MIIVEYLYEEVEGEPAPNFLWRGRTDDFMHLANDLHRLGQTNGNRIVLNKFEYISVPNDFEIELFSNENKSILNKKEGNKIIIDLDKTMWRDILLRFLYISFEMSHDYIDLEEYEVSEDANFIISSEGT